MSEDGFKVPGFVQTARKAAWIKEIEPFLPPEKCPLLLYRRAKVPFFDGDNISALSPLLSTGLAHQKCPDLYCKSCLWNEGAQICTQSDKSDRCTESGHICISGAFSHFAS